MNTVAPPKTYRFEPKEDKGQTWEQYLNFVCVYFKLSVLERTTVIENFKKYTLDGVCRHCAGYSVLRDSGLYEKMKRDVANHRPQRSDPNTRR